MIFQTCAEIFLENNKVLIHHLKANGMGIICGITNLKYVQVHKAYYIMHVVNYE